METLKMGMDNPKKSEEKKVEEISGTQKSGSFVRGKSDDWVELEKIDSLKRIDDLTQGQDDYFDGFSVVEYLEMNFLPKEDIQKEEEIRSIIAIIKEEINKEYREKDADFEFLKNPSLKIKSEAVNTMTDVAFAKAMNIQSEDVKKKIMEELHPLFSKISCSFASVPYVKIAHEKGFQLSTSPGYSNFLNADNLVDYAKPGYTTVWIDNREFWILKGEENEVTIGNLSPASTIDGFKGKNYAPVFPHHGYKKGSSLRNDAKKLEDLKGQGNNIIVLKKVTERK